MNQDSEDDSPDGASEVSTRHSHRSARWLRRPLVVLLAIGLLLLLLVAGGLGVVWWQGHNGAGFDGTYVALGSSFGAGPGAGQRAPGSPTLCMRSNDNYAHDLARIRHLKLVDATCTGATAQQVLHGGQYFQPPQVDSVGPHTKLVTLTAGGNDVSYLPNLFGWSCQHRPSGTPLAWRHEVCGSTTLSQQQRAFAALPATFDQIFAAIRRRAPHAKIVLVDYTTVLPATGTCPARLPISTAEFNRARAAATELKTLTAAAADRNHVQLFRASELTEGHDLCSAHPWVFGYRYPTLPTEWGPIPYHPTPTAMAAIANGLSKALPTTIGS